MSRLFKAGTGYGYGDGTGYPEQELGGARSALASCAARDGMELAELGDLVAVAAGG